MYLEFKKSVDELRQNVNAAASAKMSEMCDDIENRNANLAEALDHTYEAVIDSCESANDRIIPSLVTQIGKGAHVELSTQKTDAMTAAAGITRSVQYLSTEVEKTARQVSEQMCNQSGLIIRNSGERCAEAIGTQVQKHRNLAEDFQQLIAAVQKGNVQAHTAGQ